MLLSLMNYFQAKHTKNLLVLKQIYLFLALSWTIIVLSLCLMNSSDIPKVSIENADKFIHYIFHFVFTVLWFLFINKKYKFIVLKSLSIVVLMSISFGVLIELLQTFYTSTRSGDFLDVLFNTFGAILASISILMYKRVFSKK